MIFATDVYYQDNKAVAAGVMLNTWEDREAVSQLIIQVDNVTEYEPGQFYKRELPCILELLRQLRCLPAYIVVDGYVYLDDAKKPGLGKHLYDALQAKSTVIGVAKTRFKDISEGSELCRGTSQKPLYITAAGISDSEARTFITRMYGEHRIPAMLKLVDRLSRQAEES
jgi:deoxyribonuclease V